MAESLLQRRQFLGAMAGAWIAAHGVCVAVATTDPGLALLRRAIPRDGHLLPVIGLGTWQSFDFANDAAAQAQARAALEFFVAQGLAVIDTSPMYGHAEASLGRLLAATDPTQRTFIATKVWTRGRAQGRAQIELSFRLLGRAPIDLIQVHNLLDLDTQLETLAELKQQQRIRYVGASHYTAAAHADLVRTIEGGKLDFVQVNYSLIEREAAQRVLPAAAAHGVAVLINRPFAEGALFQRSKGKPLPDWAADLHCTSWAQFGLKFILGQAAVTCVIPGTRNPVHLADNIGAAFGPQADAATCRRMAGYFDEL